MINWPVWSVKIFPDMGMHAGNICFLRVSFAVVGVVSSLVARTWRLKVMVWTAGGGDVGWESLRMSAGTVAGCFCGMIGDGVDMGVTRGSS